MVKVKVCLDAGCINFIETDAGDLVIAPKPKCDILTPKEAAKRTKQIVEFLNDKAKRGFRNTYYTSKSLALEIGDEVPIPDDLPEPQSEQPSQVATPPLEA